MFGKLTLDAVPYHEPIIVVTVAAIIIGGLALLAAITYFGKWSYLWNEWGGRTLEWATSSPPPFYNFAIVPQVHERDAFWEMKEKGEAYKQPAHYEEIHMPKNSGAGIVIAAFATVFGFAMIWHIWWMAIASFIGIVATWIIKSFDEDVDYYVPVAEVEKLEKQHFDEINKAGLKNGN